MFQSTVLSSDHSEIRNEAVRLAIVPFARCLTYRTVSNSAAQWRTPAPRAGASAVVKTGRALPVAGLAPSVSKGEATLQIFPESRRLFRTKARGHLVVELCTLLSCLT